MADKDNEEQNISNINEWEVAKTADNEEGEDIIQRVNDWEFVSLTTSTYAAAPGPRGDESIHEDHDSTVGGKDEEDSPRALFMSGHFDFPASQHKNFPIMPENIEIPKGAKEVDLFAEMNVLKDGKSVEKVDEKWGVEGLDMSEELRCISFTGEKGDMLLSTHGPEFDESIARLGINVNDKEQDLFGAAELGSFHNEIVIGDSDAHDASPISNDQVEASANVIDPSSLISQDPKFANDEADDSELPCGAWWEKGVASLRAQAKETSAFWSIFVAAAVMGLVVVGQRWQRERWQTLHQRWQLSITEEKSGRILSHLKNVIVGGGHRGTYVTAASAEL